MSDRAPRTQTGELPPEIPGFSAFSAANLARCEAADGFNHPLDSWTLSDWFTAMMGELGEAANVAKKLNRVRDGIRGNKETEVELREKLRAELADTFIYLDLLAQAAGFTIGKAVVETFNRKSASLGYPVHLALESAILSALPQTPMMECHTEGDPVVWLPFSAYELVNVAAALMAGQAKYGEPDSPLQVLNSGDWFNVVGWRFEEAAERYAPHEKPNRTAADYRSGSALPSESPPDWPAQQHATRKVRLRAWNGDPYHVIPEIQVYGFEEGEEADITIRRLPSVSPSVPSKEDKP